MQIKEIFDPSRKLDRRIERVISYDAEEEVRLSAEIEEYEVTANLDDKYAFLLTKMQKIFEAAKVDEIGVWVSGFYGSGKSSFTKYLAFALDPSRKLGGEPFRKLLSSRFENQKVPSLLNSIVKQYPAVVIPIDLGTDAAAGSNMEKVSQVIYNKVLSYLGYSSSNIRVAYLEMLLDEQGRYDEFKTLASELGSLKGKSWDDVKNVAIVAGGVAAQLAPKLLPDIFPTPDDFRKLDLFKDDSTSERERVKKMLDTLRNKSGKENIIFVLDEAGQYVAPRRSLILNLDGLARNIKEIGEGRAWIIATAQQSLTEDNESAMHNAADLFRLKDRFPTAIHIEASDIREICYRRLLKKSPEGIEKLEALFEQQGASLRQITKLENAKLFDSSLDKQKFVQLYPFLPQHFEILLQLLSRIKRSGGLGLRSAIKIIQDVLVDPEETLKGKSVLSELEFGSLATSVTFYDSLRNDIDSSFSHITDAVSSICSAYGESSYEAKTSKSIAILQILGNLPATEKNLAALLNESVSGNDLSEEIDTALKNLEADSSVTIACQNGQFKFLSDGIKDIEKERPNIVIREVEKKNLINKVIGSIFSNRPSTNLLNTRKVTASLSALHGERESTIDGKNDEVGLCIAYAESSSYESLSNRLVQESNSRNNANQIFISLISPNNLDSIVDDCLRSKFMHEKHISAVEPEIREYAESQLDKAEREFSEIVREFKNALFAGSFFFRGLSSPVSSSGDNLATCCSHYLGEAAEKVFDKYAIANFTTRPEIPEKFLLAKLNEITDAIDPLQLRELDTGTPRINASHDALVEMKEFISNQGNVNGRDISRHFTPPRYGWNKETIRYLTVGLFRANEIKLTYEGQTVSIVGDIAQSAFRNNNSFQKASFSLRETKPDLEMNARAAERIEKITGDEIMPLEEDIAKAAMKHFPEFQHKCAALTQKLSKLDLAGTGRLNSLGQKLKESLQNDASDACATLGALESALYKDLDWMIEISNALDDKLITVIQEIRETQSLAESLPSTGPLVQVQLELNELVKNADSILQREDFTEEREKLVKTADELKTHIDSANKDLLEKQESTRDTFLSETIQKGPSWGRLSEEEHDQVTKSVQSIQISSGTGLEGLKNIVRNDHELTSKLFEINNKTQELANKRELEVKEDKATQNIQAPRRIETKEQIDELVKKLEALKENLPINVNW